MADGKLQMAKRREIKETRAKYAAKQNKIAVEIDPAQLARAPIVVRQNGEFVGAVISAEEYHAYEEWKEGDLRDLSPQFLADRATFKRMLPELLKTHRDKWVAVWKGQVVDVADKIGDLAEKVYEHLGYQAIYMDRVTDTPRVYRILSPRVTR